MFTTRKTNHGEDRSLYNLGFPEEDGEGASGALRGKPLCMVDWWRERESDGEERWWGRGREWRKAFHQESQPGLYKTQKLYHFFISRMMNGQNENKNSNKGKP